MVKFVYSISVYFVVMEMRTKINLQSEICYIILIIVVMFVTVTSLPKNEF